VACIAGGLQDPLISDWYWTAHEMFDLLSFDDFMKEFRVKWLPNDWEQDICCRVLGMKQARPFWEWAMKMRSLNMLLCGMATHLDDTSLLNQLEANLKPSLSRACNNERVSEETLDKWLDKVKILDEKKHREHQQQWVDAEEASHSHLKRNTTSAGLSDSSRRYNTFCSMATTEKGNGGGKPKHFDATKALPKLTDAERTLLFDNEGCLKCHRFLVNHCSANCPNDFPPTLTYKTLTAEDINAARRKTGKAIASVVDISHRSGSLLIAAIMPPTNDNTILEGDSADLLKDSDDSVSPHSVPFSFPHYHWKCAVNNVNSLDRFEVDALIDNGSHTVLIHDDLTERLGLRRRKLLDPMNVSLALLNSGNHVVTTLTDWVKLKLYDRNNLWCS
jgi:hypothetical protein